MALGGKRLILPSRQENASHPGTQHDALLQAAGEQTMLQARHPAALPTARDLIMLKISGVNHLRVT
jgi:hypothetical protein